VCDGELDNTNGQNYSPAAMDFPKEFLELKLLSCNNCGFSTPNRRLDDELIERYYGSSFVGRANKSFEMKHQTLFHPLVYDSRTFSQLLLIQFLVEIKEGMRVLEIGSGMGSFFHTLKQFDHKCEMYAIEPQIQAHFFLEKSNVNIIKTTFKKNNQHILDNFSNFFDLIVMSHSLEHFNATDIPEILKNINQILKPDGHYFCEVPNADLVKYPNAGEKDIPHLAFFTEKSLNLCLNNAGFKVKFLSSVGELQTKKKAQKKYNKYEKLGFYNYKKDEEKGLMISEKYHEFIKLSSEKQKRKDIFFKVIKMLTGSKGLSVFLNLYKKKISPSIIQFVGKEQLLKYGKDREYLRSIAQKSIL
jgi:ubiquinone/menaquinone biosynthesis C-methylase UbiE